VFRKKSTLGKSIEKFESIIGASLRIEGDLVATNSLRIDGVVNGNILQSESHGATVAVAVGATITGNIAASDVIVSGTVCGDIVATGRVEVVDSAKVQGNITYGSIGVTPGAKIIGQLSQIDEGAQMSAAKAIDKAAKSVEN
jgi:cytoskeletal protein CcmA (bactofilin family)